MRKDASCRRCRGLGSGVSGLEQNALTAAAIKNEECRIDVKGLAPAGSFGPGAQMHSAGGASWRRKMQRALPDLPPLGGLVAAPAVVKRAQHFAYCFPVYCEGGHGLPWTAAMLPDPLTIYICTGTSLRGQTATNWHGVVGTGRYAGHSPARLTPRRGRSCCGCRCAHAPSCACPPSAHSPRELHMG